MMCQSERWIYSLDLTAKYVQKFQVMACWNSFWAIVSQVTSPAALQKPVQMEPSRSVVQKPAAWRHFSSSSRI